MNKKKLLSLLLMMCAGWIACAHAPSAEQRLPTLHLNFEPKDVIAMEPVTFDISVEGDGAGVSYVWDFDASNGIQVDAIGAKATHIYPVAGNYEIRVTATDGRGRTRAVSTYVAATARKYAPHAPITLADQTFPPGQPHIIEGCEIQAGGKNAIYLRNCANVVIRNCYLHDSDYAILAEGCRNIRVIGCYIDRNKRGILFEGSPENLSHDIQVSRNVVTRCLRTDGISFRWAADVEVDLNALKDNGKIWEDRISGISFNGFFRNISIHDNFVARSNSDGVELMGERQRERSSQIEVYHNTLRDNGEQGVWLLHLTDSRVHHNLIFGSHNNGVFLEWDVSKVRIDHNLVVGCGRRGGGAVGLWHSFSNFIENNVLTKNAITGISIGCPKDISAQMQKEGYYPFVSRDNIIRNNIIVDNAEGNIAVDAEIQGTQFYEVKWCEAQIRYNDVWQSKGGRNYRGCKPGPGNISVDPRFRNPIAGDFTLRDDSSCIDAGDPDMRDTDGSRIDMGIGILKNTDTGHTGIIERRSDIPFFGIEEDFDKENDIVSLTSKDLRDLGVKIVRTHGGPFVWDSIEPRKGKFDFTSTDKAVREAFYSGVSIIASLWPYALWDQGDIESCKVSGKIDAMRGRVPDYRCKPQNMKAYRSFLRELVERYDGDDDFGTQPISDELKEIIRQNPVIYWEIDNEVDAGDNKEFAKFFVGALEDYVDLLKNSYTAIKEASEECQVIVAAPAGSIRDYYSLLFSLGARDYFDVYNLHGPIQELRETVGSPREISSGRHVVESTSIPYLTGSLDKPVFITEAGGKEGAELAKEAILLASEGATLAVLNMAPDWPKYYTKNIDGDPKKEEEFFKGYLLSKDGSKASAYYALQTLTTELEYFKKIEPIEVGIGVAGFKFYFEENDPVYVFFINGFGRTEETIFVEFGRFTVKDLYGDEKTIEGKSFTLKKDSVYFVKPIDADGANYDSSFSVTPPSDVSGWHFGTLAFDYKYVPLIMEKAAIAKEFEREARVAAQAGAYWIRPHLTELFAWGFTERKRGEYNWEILDLLVRTCQKYGIHLLPQLWTTSTWDQNLKPGDPTDAHSAFFTLGVWPWTQGESMRPRNMSAYLNWLKALVERYDGDGVADMEGLLIPIRHYEILNEPDIREDVVPFVEVQKRSYETIKEENPNIVVVLGGQMGPRQLATYLKLGIASYCDIINIHGFLSEEYQMVLRKFNVDKPIWITELGYEFERFIGESMDEERRQASELVKLYARSFARGAEKIFWIEMLGQVKPPIKWEYPIPHEQQGACLYPSKKGPRLAYFTHQLMASKIGAFTEVQEMFIENRRDVECYRFTADGKSVYILWLNRDGVEFVDLKIPYTSVTVAEMIPLDKTGRVRTSSLKAKKGIVRLKLSETPILVIASNTDAE